MNLKEALSAHFSGKSVQVKTKGIQEPYESLFNRIANFTFSDLNSDSCGVGCEFRLAPRTIIVNGVEVPAPEKSNGDYGSAYYIPDLSSEDLYSSCAFSYTGYCERNLERGLVYLNKEDAIARAKAMLITKEV